MELILKDDTAFKPKVLRSSFETTEINNNVLVTMKMMMMRMVVMILKSLLQLQLRRLRKQQHLQEVRKGNE